MKNYYQILEVSENASPEIIEKAYRVLAKKYHPDIQPRDKLYWAENKFKEITEAYDVLSDSELRENYDMKIGLNTSQQESYNSLYSEHENLKQEFNNLKINTESQKYVKNEQEATIKKGGYSYIKKYVSGIGTLIYNETKKPAEERSRDLKALILTIIIVSILIFIFWKVPFLNKLVFP